MTPGKNDSIERSCDVYIKKSILFPGPKSAEYFRYIAHQGVLDYILVEQETCWSVLTVCWQLKLSLSRPCNDCIYPKCEKQLGEEITYLFPFSVVSHLRYQNQMLINIIL